MTPLTLTFHDVNDAYSEIQSIKERFSEWESTRNGPALAFQAPVIIQHCSPYRRVLFDPLRDANPFFHYMEAIWMLAGEEHTKFLEQFVPSITDFSDDRLILNGAYGYRWRSHFEGDQIEAIIEMLTKDRYTRRAVIGMWDPSFDLAAQSKDLPCNTHIYFRTVMNALDMTVCNRSNDLVWGALGANVVHMGILQEYIAAAVGMHTGNYYQFTNNLHVYEGWTEPDKFERHPSRWYREHPGMQKWKFTPETFSIAEAQDFCTFGLEVENPYRCRILRDNAEPMLRAHQTYKTGDVDLALHYADKIYDDDWRVACMAWIERRRK